MLTDEWFIRQNSEPDSLCFPRNMANRPMANCHSGNRRSRVKPETVSPPVFGKE